MISSNNHNDDRWPTATNAGTAPAYAALDESDAGVVLDLNPARVPLQWMVEYYGNDRSLSKGHRKRLLETVANVEAWSGGTIFTDMLNDDLLLGWLAAEQARGISPVTMKKRREFLVILWSEAWRRHFTDLCPQDTKAWKQLEVGRTDRRNKAPLDVKPAEPGTLRHLLRESYAPKKLRGKSVHAVRLHENTLNNLAKFLGREALLADLDDDVAAGFLAWLRSCGRKASTANNNRFRLLALWRFAARKRLVDQWPDVEPDIEPKRIPRAWTVEELHRLFQELRRQTGRIAGIPAADWWTTLHLLGWDSGERISALLAVRWQSIDLGARRLLVPAEDRKGKREDRIYLLHEQTVDLLRRIREPSRELVLPWPHTPTYIYHVYRKIQENAGLPQGRDFRFHCLRKAVASHGKLAGLDPQALMGHADGKVTAKYLDPAIVGEQASGSTLFRPVEMASVVTPAIGQQGGKP